MKIKVLNNNFSNAEHGDLFKCPQTGRIWKYGAFPLDELKDEDQLLPEAPDADGNYLALILIKDSELVTLKGE